MSLKMQLSEGHLGGYILDQAAPGTWCPKIWDWLIEECEIHSMLDIGCGLGFVMKYFNEKGCEVLGVDGSPSAIKNHVFQDFVVQHDYSTGPWIPDRDVDLVWSSEFLEHVEERYMGNFLLSFSKAKKFIVATYAIPGQRGHHHVNENTEDYWLGKFAMIGFEIDHSMTAKARTLVDSEGIEGKQFREKGLVLRRKK